MDGPTYRVTLEVFEGPLDLLLRLIEREELDISQVSLALVADQYLVFIAQLADVPAVSLADFLVVAAKLMVIKSRSLLPKPAQPAEDEDEEDVGEALARQLQEYKRYKELAAQLRQIEESGLRSYPRVAPPPSIDKPLQPGQVSPLDLLEAIKRVFEVSPTLRPVDGVVAPVVVRIGDCIRTIQALLRLQPRVHFSQLIRQARSRTEILVTFMAILELIKQQYLRATQEAPFAEIILERLQPDLAVPAPVADLSDYSESDEPPPNGSSDYP